MQRSGEPDISGEYPTTSDGWVHLKIEVKTEEGAPSPLQLFRLRNYWRAGYLVGIVTSVEEFIILCSCYEDWLRRCDGSKFMPPTDYPEMYKERHND